MTFFHGTKATLEPGAVLVPGRELGIDNWTGMDNNGLVWLHDNPTAAGMYGSNVYEVVCPDWVENYSEQAGHIEEGLPAAEWEYVTPRAIVVGKV